MKKFAIALFIAAALFVSLLLPVFLQGAPGANGESAGGLVPLANSVPNLNNTRNFIITPDSKDYNPNQKLTLVLSLGTPLNGIDSLLGDPNSPFFHKFLSPSEIAAEYGVSESTYQQIVQYFTGIGFNVTSIPTRNSLVIEGTASLFDSALHTSINAFTLNYNGSIWNPVLSQTRVFYANTLPLYLSSSIQQYVTGISGFQGGFALPQVYLPYNIKPMQQPAKPGSYNNSQLFNINNGYYGWWNGSQVGSSISEQMFFPGTMPRALGAWNLWNGSSSINGKPDQGQGVTIALIEVGFIDPTVISDFSQAVFGNSSQLLDRFTQVGIGISSLAQGINDGYIWGWYIETALDVEYAAAMAPQAHIVVIGVPNPLFTSFDASYAIIAGYFAPGTTCTPPSGVTVFNGNNSAPGQAYPSSACPIDITSNSYGASEAANVYAGSPVYVTLENQLLATMETEGITNFFAAGDNGAYGFGIDVNIPADSPSSTSVGGGSLFLSDNSGNPYPNTGVNTTLSTVLGPLVVTFANATKILEYTYWSYGIGLGGSFQGIVGGGFGQSFMNQQPWWEHATDVYNSGQLIVPILSGQADFQYAVFFDIPQFALTGLPWNPFFGGTSFATPVEAGLWALVEEQVGIETGQIAMGNINPLLFLAHNSEAITGINPFIAMSPKPVPSIFDSTGPENFWIDQYVHVYGSILPDENLPAWFASMDNPQGSGWNYLQGLGLTQAVNITEVVLKLVQPKYTIMQVLPDGTELPFTSLVGGNIYEFQVFEHFNNGTTAPAAFVPISAYSGDTYLGGGATHLNGETSTIFTNSSGYFVYAPVYNSNPGNAGEYSAFNVDNSTLVQFETTVPYPVQGTLTLGIETPNGIVTSGVAQVPMTYTYSITDIFGTPPYVIGQQVIVTLNGQPVADAQVYQQAILVNYSLIDPTVPPSAYAPGVILGSFVTGLEGHALIWTNAFIALNNGPVPTQVYKVWAQYGGLKSAPVYVFVEPQAGMFYPTLNIVNNNVQGIVAFSLMRYINSITIQVGNQSVTVTYPNSTFSNQASDVSGVFEGVVPVDFNNVVPPPGTPVKVNIQATGVNNFTFTFCFFGSCFVSPDVSQLMWTLSYNISNPGPEPTASVSVPQGVQGGTVTISWSGSWVLNTATARLQLISQSGSVLNLSTQLSGTLNFNTETVPDGVYSVQLTVTTPTGLTATASAPLVIANTLLTNERVLQGEVNQLLSTVSTLENRVTQLTNEVTQLTNEVSQLTSQVTSLQNQNAQLNKTNAQLQAQLQNVTQLYNEAESTISNLKAQISSLNQQVSSLQATNEQLHSNITQLQNTITQMQNTITSLNSQINSLQAQLTQAKANLTQALEMLSAQSTTISAQTGQIHLLIGGLAAVIVAAIASIAYFARKK